MCWGMGVAIQSFKDSRAEAIFNARAPGKRFPPELIRRVKRKLEMLDAAVELKDLMAPPANRLEALTGDRAGQHSIRVNDQFRLCFAWTANGPAGVEFIDYH